MKRIILTLISLIIFFVSIRGIFFSSIILSDNKTINEAVKILSKYEDQDIDKVKNEIMLEKKKYEEENLAHNYEDVTYSQFYKDTLFLGDSITEGLIDYSFVSEYNVLAKKGGMVKDAFSEITRIKEASPSNIVLFYGMNDVIEYNNSNEELTANNFKKTYIDLISEIKRALPNTKIFIISPTNVIDDAINKNYRLTNENLNEFRNIIKEVCKETNVKYVDVNSKIINRNDLHESDGIHFKYEFYNIWLDTLKESMLEGE